MGRAGEIGHDERMNFNHFVVLGWTVAAFLVGAVVMWRAVRNAPEGFEDEEGFQLQRVPVTAAPAREAELSTQL